MDCKIPLPRPKIRPYMTLLWRRDEAIPPYLVTILDETDEFWIAQRGAYPPERFLKTAWAMSGDARPPPSAFASS